MEHIVVDPRDVSAKPPPRYLIEAAIQMQVRLTSSSQ